jgi:hypothetical protein
MPMDVTRTEHKPHDRLTRICEAMAKAMEDHPEYRDGEDKAMVFMDSDVERMGGIVMFGYDSDAQAIERLFMHLTAVLKANGKEMRVVEVGEG